MIKPLSLLRRPQSAKQLNEWISPLRRQRADSLVFSITSSKQQSPKDSILILSEHTHPLSKQLQTLQLKLQHLQSRVQRIDCDSYTYNQNDTSSHLFLNTQKIQSQNLQENKDLNITTVGKIVTKINRQSKNNKTKPSKNHSYSKFYHLDTQKRSNITTEQSMVVQKTRQIQKLKTRVRNMKASVEKSQKSVSLCSQRLSASKKELKTLKRQQAKRQKAMTKLRCDLKRSQAIREKQKELIFKQQQQIKQLRLQLTSYHSK